MDFSNVEDWLRKDWQNHSAIKKGSIELEFYGRIDVKEMERLIDDYLPKGGEELSTERVAEGDDRVKLSVKELLAWTSGTRTAMKNLKMRLHKPDKEDPFLADLEIRHPMSVVTQKGERNWNITGWRIGLLRKEPGNINSPMVSFQDTIQWQLQERQENGSMKILATVNSTQEWKPYEPEVNPNA